MACGNSWARDQTHATEATRTAAVTMPDSSPTVPKNIFQVPLDIDFERAGAAKELIDTLNNYMNLKAVYQRSLNLLNKDSVHLSIAQYFPSYFNTVWNNDSQAIIDEIIQKTTTRNKKEEIIKVADELFTNFSQSLLGPFD